MTHGPTRTCIVPDLDGDLLQTLGVVEEVLLLIAAWESDGRVTRLPAPVGERTALEAVPNVMDRLRCTQSPVRRGRLLSPDGNLEHLPFTFVDISLADLATLAATCQVIGASAPTTAMAEAANALAQAYGFTRAGLAAQFVRVLELLDLSWNADVELLYARLRDAAPGADVRLNAAEETAHQATVNRISTLWDLGRLSPLVG